jgi:two-component system sensor histidine kinase PilS (NtrC family)
MARRRFFVDRVRGETALIEGEAAEHLRRVLVNLLDNADRYASSNPGAIRVSTAKAGNSQAPTLSVWSHGPELDPQVRQHLFEPFVSSHSRSSGLGLYICRELCERYGATLGYERQAVGTQVGNAFVVRWPTPHNAT